MYLISSHVCGWIIFNIFYFCTIVCSIEQGLGSERNYISNVEQRPLNHLHSSDLKSNDMQQKVVDGRNSENFQQQRIQPNGAPVIHSKIDYAAPASDHRPSSDFRHEYHHSNEDNYDKQSSGHPTDPRLSADENGKAFGFQHVTPETLSVKPATVVSPEVDQLNFHKTVVEGTKDPQVRRSLEGQSYNSRNEDPVTNVHHMSSQLSDSDPIIVQSHVLHKVPGHNFQQPAIQRESEIRNPDSGSIPPFNGYFEDSKHDFGTNYEDRTQRHYPDMSIEKLHRINNPETSSSFKRHSDPSLERQSPHLVKQGVNANIPREFQLDESYLIPSVDNHPRSLSDDFVSMTLIVPPGVKECAFYVPISNFILDYQVIRGGGLDIAFFVRDPQGEPIVRSPPSPDGTVSIKVPPHFQLRPYAICLDNRKASFADKHVAFSIDLDLNWDNPSAHERAVIEALRKRSFADAAAETIDAEYMEGWKALSDRMESLFGRLRRVEHLQQKTDNFASVDKALMEANAHRVLRGSLLQIFIMIAVSSVQVILIRAFFDFNSRFYRVWFGKRSKTSARC